MFFRALFDKSPIKKNADKLYNAIVAQARTEEFYRSYKVSDTLEGRFEMIVLHLFLYLQRLKQEKKQDEEIGKLVLEVFFSELDGSLREMGVGDLSVPKKMKKLAESFYGRIYSYSEALESKDNEKLKNEIKTNIYFHMNDDTNSQDESRHLIAAMTEYVLNSYKAVGSTPLEDFLAGDIQFIQPEIAR